MADDLAALRAKLAKLNGLLTGSQLRRVTEKVAQRSKPVAAQAVSPNTLSHWGRGKKKGGYKVQARYEIKSDHEAVIQPTIAPLAALLEKGSGNTWKAPKRKGSARRKKGTVGSYTRTPVPPREAWTKAQKAVENKAPGFVHDEVVRALREVF